MNRPRYILALFDDAPWKEGDPERRTTDPKAGGGRRKPAAPERPVLRDPKTGEFVTIDKLEGILKAQADKEHELNQENARRRNENKELNEKLKTLSDAHEGIRQRALRTEVIAALTNAKAVDPDVVADAFVRWAGDKVKVGPNLAVEGVTAENITEFQKLKPKLFESTEGGGGGGEPKVIGGKDWKPNATSKGAGAAGGSGTEDVPNVKLDFSNAKTPEDVQAIVDAYKESLR